MNFFRICIDMIFDGMHCIVAIIIPIDEDTREKIIETELKQNYAKWN